MRLLVTGGAGFIGSHYVRTVLQGGYPGYEPDEVVVLDALTYAGNRANLDPVAEDPRLRLVVGDIRDAEAVDPLVAQADHVVHFAAESHVDRSIGGAADFVLTNVVGTQVLLDAALRHGVDKFVHVSTDEVYGSIENGSWPEDQPLEPNSPYSASKAGSDLLARAFYRTHGLPVCITRCSNNYGRTSSRRRSSRCSSATCSTAARSRCTATARTSATGCTWTTTAAASSSCSRAAAPARSTTSAAAPS
jgi:dTDP-glucose 4,6-dehydratase